VIKNRDFFHIPLPFDAPVRGAPVGILTPFGMEETRMARLPDGEKRLRICITVLTEQGRNQWRR